ncbi:4-amino-4-deoxy-L-arabinose transferase-like glycosyltransferase [Oxalobacteraceae bacterium GrIS 2.11]
MLKQPASSNSLWIWLSLVLFLVIWFYMLGARTLVPTDEGRYAEMAREMVVTGDWITPRLNAIKYFEKPPLQTWMNAITFELFGLGEWQARLWTGLSALFGIGLIGYTGSRLFSPKVGITAAVVLASSFWWAGMGHVNSLDMGLSGMMTLALCGLLLAQRDQATPREQRNGMLLCWLGMALATMSKGPMAIVLPGAVLFIYTFVARDWRIWQRLHLGKGLLLYFAVTAPWFVLVSQANEEFLHFFFIHEHVERFLSKVHHRDGPWYYFIPLLIVGIFPWLGLLLQSLWHGTKQQASTFQPGKLLLVWAAFIFFFFSTSSSKLPSYILPIFPALALLIAMHLERKTYRGLLACGLLMSLFGLAGMGVWAFSASIPALHKNAFDAALNQSYLPWLGLTSLLMFLSGIAACILARYHQQRAVWVLAWAGFLCGQLLMLGHEPWGRYIAGTEHLTAIKAELTPTMPLYAVGRYEQALPFYLQHTTILVEHPDEMEFGLQYEPQLWIPKRADFVQQWLNDQSQGITAMAIMRPDIYAEFIQQGIPMRLIAQDPRRVIVSSKLK